MLIGGQDRNMCFINMFHGVIYFLLILLIAPQVFSKTTIPNELYEGMIEYELKSGSYFNALVLMDDAYKESHPIRYADGLKGFHIDGDVSAIIEKAKNSKKDIDWFTIGKIEYDNNECKPSLRAFKKLKNKLTLDEKQKWAFYRANCFIKLGSKKRAAQVLNDMLGGIWTSYAYFNLAMAYAETSQNKSTSLVTLRIAESFLIKETREEKALKDRINLAAGSLYLNGNKPDLALEFFKKVYLDSESAADALYLNGVAYHELGDFRSATQAWFSVKKYPLLKQSVSEAYLAIPFAYEASKYTSQALEAYLEASSVFKNELNKIDKIKKLLKKYGVQKVLIDESEIAGLQWFLAKDVVTNTTRAIYYNYFVKDETIYDLFELHAEVSMTKDSMVFWDTQLSVFEQALKEKHKTFNSKVLVFKKKNTRKLISKYKSKVDQLSKHKNMTNSLSTNLGMTAVLDSVATLSSRLATLQEKVKKGGGVLKDQLQQIKVLKKKIHSADTSIDTLLKKLDTELTLLVTYKLSELRASMVVNYEKAEQGLVHILETIAESKQLQKRTLLDGRYK